MPRLNSFFTLFLGVSVALASFTTLSCNGNGGGSDSEGETYKPGGSANQQSSSASSGSSISATDILNSSNSGEDMESLVDRLVNGGTTAQNADAGTQTVIFSADSIGLPAGGTATLTISGAATIIQASPAQTRTAT